MGRLLHSRDRRDNHERNTDIRGGLKTYTAAYESEFTAYSTGNEPKFVRQGNIVTVSGVAKPVVDLPYSQGWRTLCKIPAGYKPTSDGYGIMQGSGMNIWQFGVNSQYVRFSRYRIGETGNTCAAGAWLPFTFTYMTTDPMPD